MNFEVAKVNYYDQLHAQNLVSLMDYYAQDPMGGGKALKEDVKKNLAKQLSKLSHAFSVMAFADGKAIGLINCFEAFSTFACKPLINIHDVIVLKEYRGQGVAQMMLQKVEDVARDKGCCKITLEVLSGNEKAKSSYKKFGFRDYELDPKMGTALFWEKQL